MKRILLTISLLLLTLGSQVRTVQAQDTPHIFDSTKPITPELRSALDAWLAVDNPSVAVYYVVTYTLPRGYETLVSLAGFDDVTMGWSITGDANGNNHVQWLGSVRVMADGTVELLTADVQQVRGNGRDLASIDFMPPPAPMLAGGGDTVRFPLSAAKSFQYGPLGVHAAGYTGSGLTGAMVAVDFVSGSDMGVNFASPWVFASWPGEIVYVCEDSDSTAIIVESLNGAKFLYAHLIQNDTLVLEHSFSPEATIGALKWGSFGAPNEGCGWADQRPNQYHIHWGIEPANGVFRAESCVLRIATGLWQCGSVSSGPTEYLTARGVNDVTDPYSSPTMFDYIMVGVLNIYDKAIVQQLPENTSGFPLTTALYNSFEIVFRVVNVLVMGHLNLTPTIGLWIIAIAWKIAFGVIWLIGAVLRTIKAIPTF
jgi:hypothetical protein